MVTMVIVGGSTSITGAFAGALYVRGIPYFFGGSWVVLLSSGAGLLLVLLFVPGGLASFLFRLRDRVVGMLAAGVVAPEEPKAAPLRLEPRPKAEHDEGDVGARPPAIATSGIVKRYGGLVAVNGVSLEARPGEIVGLIGPNGAGKTTLFDILSGLVTPDAGHVMLSGADVTALSPDERAWLGLGRSFQQCRLFEGLTILETFALALEREEPTELVPSLFALPPSAAAERDKRITAAELVDLLGLGQFAEKTATELSTGTRRIAELGCSVALGASVILLDEPTGGVAQREVEAFVPVLRQIRDHLDATMLIVAHDIPMIINLVDRVYVMASGEVIAEGPPTVLQTDRQVIAAYLGTDDEDEVIHPVGVRPEPAGAV
jgi:ABC-type branched-subunit amino acid transport system ATPase component